MENRIHVSLDVELKNQVLKAVDDARKLMPFLIKVTDAEKRDIQQMDDGRRPFTEKACDFATRNAAINPGDALVNNAKADLELYNLLSTVENELKQLLEMVTDTKQLAGAEAYEVARFVYMKSKMAAKMREPGMDAIVDELGKLFKGNGRSAAAKSELV